MNGLVIKLTGTIQSSNFDLWKNDLVEKIKVVNTNLVTNEDFVDATRQVYQFKAAEKALKAAKQAAIEQASDIQNLFSAIDEVSEEARQVRLSLERQIKKRKLEIKEESISSAIESIQSYIAQKDDVFEKIDHSVYLDRKRFEVAIKGRAGIRGVQLALERLCADLKADISEREVELLHNKKALDTLSVEFRPLFQDHSYLLSLGRQELKLVMDKRIAVFNSEKMKKKSQETVNELQDFKNSVLNPHLPLSEMLRALANGVDPLSRELLGESSLTNQPETIRLLFALSEELRRRESSVAVDVHKSLDDKRRDNLAKGRPARSHFAWGDEERERIAEMYKSGMMVAQIAKAVERTCSAVRIQLERLGLVEPNAETEPE